MSEKEEIPVAAARTDTGADTANACDVCATPIEMEEWHPIATEWDADGDLIIHEFCSQDCRETWSDS